MHDVIVVGGGPGGLYSAYQLARAGFDVAVLEEHPTAGVPVHCTGVLASEAYDEFELPHEAILNTLARARFLSPSGRVVEYTTATTEALVVDRVLFDRGLHERARKAGATLRLGTRVTAISVGAVAMGATTYIGNAPNFMVKAIAEEAGVKMPSFFGYMAYSGVVLIPLFVLVTFVFFRQG